MSRRGRLVAAGVGALAGRAWFPGEASAHGLVGRADLPVPPWLFGWAAALVLVISFVALAALWPRPRLQEPRRRALFGVPGWADTLCGLVGVALFLAVVYAGFNGTKEATANLAPNLIYVYFWVGFVVFSVLLGDIFRAFNPWRAVARGARWTIQRTTGKHRAPPLDYPAAWGRWPAVIGILGFAWLELAYVNKADPSTLAALSLGYAVVQLVALALFGVERWSERGDAFSVYFNLYSRLAAFERDDGVVYLRTPLSGAPPYPLLPGTVALLSAAIGTTTFDGLSNVPCGRRSARSFSRSSLRSAPGPAPEWNWPRP